ncbi:hypothetical protein ONS95_002986 [Cadophora gregata]|uniref:uncharacterized protein n=1 Tax=Cadophora gregata TaxID=51156 RepID=UPI0026DCF815|nr:uncharacterized protein ONS95_002986 [Cadophora gregata]KAK0108164.1 hypothetical protein ONS95_002986 [Cadophora gregata]
MKYIGIEVMLNFLMLALMAIAAPAISTSEEPNAVPLNLISYPTPDTSTITSVSPQGIEYIQLGDKDFQPCFPNFGQAIMCTINYISHPSWNNEVQPFMYDNECKRIGENYHAPRSMLAAKWGWRMTVKLDYGDVHLNPFYKNNLGFDSSYTIKGYVGEYRVFRAAFPRQVDLMTLLRLIVIFSTDGEQRASSVMLLGQEVAKVFANGWSHSAAALKG